MTTWLITGCSTGLGRALAAAVLARGDNAVVTARDASAVADLVAAHPSAALPFALDVTAPAQVRAAVVAAEDRFGGVDVLVNNAGYGYRAAVEEGDPSDVEALFATNFFGAVDVIKAVLPGMRARRSGAIVNVSSIGARVCPPGSGYYAAVKAALEGMTSSLRKEVAPLGITAMAVEPGGFRTDFAGRSLNQAATPIADYAATAGQRRKENDTADGNQPGDPAKAASAIIEAVLSPDPPALLVLGRDALDAFSAVLDAQRAELEKWRGGPPGGPKGLWAPPGAPRPSSFPDRAEHPDRSADLEAAQPFDRLVEHLGRRHVGLSRPPVHPADQVVDALRVALEHRLDPPVGQVAHPPGDPVVPSHPAARIPEENPLYHPGHHHPLPNHRPTLWRSPVIRTLLHRSAERTPVTRWRADQFWSRERVLPSGSLNQATSVPPGAVHTPSSSWSMPSTSANSTPRAVSSRISAWMSATSQPRTVKGCTW
jgi:NAD(P)-dependent dehydrogenase (short-subunit alcohol dehydrogenase family)